MKYTYEKNGKREQRAVHFECQRQRRVSSTLAHREFLNTRIAVFVVSFLSRLTKRIGIALARYNYCSKILLRSLCVNENYCSCNRDEKNKFCKRSELWIVLDKKKYVIHYKKIISDFPSSFSLCELWLVQVEFNNCFYSTIENVFTVLLKKKKKTNSVSMSILRRSQKRKNATT